MEKRDWVRLRYSLVGWFTLSVWIAGGPRVVTFAYDTIKDSYAAVKCEFTSCGGEPLLRPNDDAVKAWILRSKAGKIPPLEHEEIAFLMAVKDANKL
jgi:hypothetical protein